MVVMFTMLAYGKQSYGYTYVVVTRFGRYVNLLQSRALFLGALETPSGRSGNSDALMISLSCLTWSLLLCLGACTPLDFHVWYIERQVFFWSSALFPALEFHSSAWTSGRNIVFSVRCILHTPWMINPKTTHSLDSPSRILTGKAKFPWEKKKRRKKRRILTAEDITSPPALLLSDEPLRLVSQIISEVRGVFNRQSPSCSTRA